MEGLNNCSQEEDELYGEYADWTEDAFVELQYDGEIDYETIDAKGKKRWDDLKNSSCYKDKTNPFTKIFVTGFSERKNSSMRYAAGIFINSKERAFSITSSYPFIDDKMEKITTKEFKKCLHDSFIDFTETIKKIILIE